MDVKFLTDSCTDIQYIWRVKQELMGGLAYSLNSYPMTHPLFYFLTTSSTCPK